MGGVGEKYTIEPNVTNTKSSDNECRTKVERANLLPFILFLTTNYTLKLLAMKGFRLYLCLILFLPSALCAQKMISVDNRWNFYNPGDFSGYGRGIYASFFKDSVEIDGKYYYQTYSTTDSTFQDATATHNFYREENGIVYQRDERLKSEEIIYNFNLNAGDSIIYLFGTFQQIVKVLAVDSIKLLDKTTRKRLTLYNPRYAMKESNFRYWIEGIGGLVQTFNPSLMYASDGTSSLSCFFHKGDYTYGYYIDKCPDKLGRIIIDNTKEITPLQGVQLLQNLGDGNISFRLENPGQYQCKVYNTLGSLLQTQIARQGDNFISVTSFPKGIYFLQVYDLENQRQKTFKLLNH